MNINFKKEFQNKQVLITGGTGSIGAVIVKELLKYDPKKIKILSRDESKQFELMQEIGKNNRIDFLIGDIKDKERIDLAMENVDIVFHTAALKHVVSCERNPLEAIKTNVLGTKNVIDSALMYKVEKFVGISTDKASDPTNVMGCTKLLAEKLMLTSRFYKGDRKTRFCFVRFGNVLGSRGSVVPLFMNQIMKGLPITITDPQMTRFFMTIKDAVNLVFKATTLMQDREIFILKMPSIVIRDLAEAIIEFMNKKGKIKINIIGKKEGEKIHEKLLNEEDLKNVLETDDMFIILPEDREVEPKLYLNAKQATTKVYDSFNQEKISIKEIIKMLKKA